MRGFAPERGHQVSTLSPEELVPATHPSGPIRRYAGTAHSPGH